MTMISHGSGRNRHFGIYCIFKKERRDNFRWGFQKATRSSPHPQIAEDVEPAVFRLSTTTCAKSAFSEGTRMVTPAFSLIKLDLSWKPMGILRRSLQSTKKYIEVTTEVIMWKIHLNKWKIARLLPTGEVSKRLSRN